MLNRHTLSTVAKPLTVLLLALAVNGCSTLLPHTFPPSYQTNAGQQCIKACWQGGKVGCTNNPFDHCWYNDRCKEQCDAAERSSLDYQKKQK